jgi:alpha-galactosidase
MLSAGKPSRPPRAAVALCALLALALSLRPAAGGASPEAAVGGFGLSLSGGAVLVSGGPVPFEVRVPGAFAASLEQREGSAAALFSGPFFRTELAFSPGPAGGLLCRVRSEGALPPAVGARLSGGSFWAFRGGPHHWGEEVVGPLSEPWRAEYPLLGGVPAVDAWGPQGGLCLGVVAPEPERLIVEASPVFGGAKLAARKPGGEEMTVLLAPHRGDFWAGLRAYAETMGRLAGWRSLPAPEAAYLPRWETWGFREGWRPEDVLAVLPELAAMGVGAVTIDAGWQKGGADGLVGDWEPDPQKFPGGEADLKALVDAVHSYGMKAYLWWTPGAASPDSELAAAHPERLARDESGEPAWLPLPDDGEGVPRLHYALCPALPEAIEWHRAFVRRALLEWGFDGLKLDGMYGAPPCFDPAHGHADPEETFGSWPELFRTIAEEALACRPHAALEICSCGVPQNFWLMPFQNSPVTSDPVGSWQMRMRAKILKALFGPRHPVLSDHVELTRMIDTDGSEREGPPDFASALAAGTVLEFKVPGFVSGGERTEYARWLGLWRELGAARGEYLGGLYDVGFDRPEGHAVRLPDGSVLYGFFVPWDEEFSGTVELRGLEPGRAYGVLDAASGEVLGRVSGPAGRAPVRFAGGVLLRALPD